MNPWNPIRVSVLVVSYRTRELTLASLRSLYAETRDTVFEVLVADNASPDGSAEALREAFGDREDFTLVALEENLGFAAANNLLAARARGELLLLLNPDTVVLDGAVDALVAFADARPSAGIWGGRTEFADGSANPTFCWGRYSPWAAFCRATGLSAAFRRSRWLHPEGVGYWATEREREVDIVSGCFLLVRRDLWERLGGFDPAFFMYGEEADLCLRARALGARPRITRAARIVHHGGASESGAVEKQVKLHAAKARLVARHWPRWQRGLGRSLLAGGVALRAAAYRLASVFAARRFAEHARSWSDVWRRRGEWLARTDRDLQESTA